MAERPFEREHGVSVPRSGARETPSGVVSFSTLDDYVGALAEVGRVQDVDDLLTDPRLVPAVFHDWVRQGQTGCWFARRFARNPGSWGWLNATWMRAADDPKLGPAVEQVLRASYSSQAVLMAFPLVRDIKSWLELVRNLCANEQWGCEQVVTSSDDEEREIAAADEGYVVIGLRWHPLDEEKPAWPLAFGPLGEFPFTRRAPVSALVMRTHSPLGTSAGIDLAAMNTRMRPESRDKFTRRSHVDKHELLNGELLHVARARSTLRVPARSAEERLGLAIH